MLRDVVTRREQVLGASHFSTFLAKGNLGAALISAGELVEAEPYAREALDGYRTRFGDEDPRTVVLKGNLAYLLEDLGHTDEAIRLYRETIETQRNSNGTLGPETWATLNNLAMLLVNHDRADEARPLFDELLAMCDALLPEGHYYTAIFRNNHAQCLTALGEYTLAMDAIERSHPVLIATFGPDHERVARSNERRALIESMRR
jgi:tetratricopeptide (TPR) repeat protein